MITYKEHLYILSLPVHFSLDIISACATRASCSISHTQEQDMDQAYDSLAANLGIDHFSVMLRRAIKQEQDDVLGQAKRPK